MSDDPVGVRNRPNTETTDRDEAAPKEEPGIDSVFKYVSLGSPVLALPKEQTGRVVLNLRELFGIGPEPLAAAWFGEGAGGRSDLRQIEAGKKEITLPQAEKLCQVLGVAPSAFFVLVRPGPEGAGWSEAMMARLREGIWDQIGEKFAAARRQRISDRDQQAPPDPGTGTGTGTGPVGSRGPQPAAIGRGSGRGEDLARTGDEVLMRLRNPNLGPPSPPVVQRLLGESKIAEAFKRAIEALKSSRPERAAVAEALYLRAGRQNDLARELGKTAANISQLTRRAWNDLAQDAELAEAVAAYVGGVA